jgi:hypothetical protein
MKLRSKKANALKRRSFFISVTAFGSIEKTTGIKIRNIYYNDICDYMHIFLFGIFWSVKLKFYECSWVIMKTSAALFGARMARDYG